MIDKMRMNDFDGSNAFIVPAAVEESVELRTESGFFYKAVEIEIPNSFGISTLPEVFSTHIIIETFRKRD